MFVPHVVYNCTIYVAMRRPWYEATVHVTCMNILSIFCLHCAILTLSIAYSILAHAHWLTHLPEAWVRRGGWWRAGLYTRQRWGSFSRGTPRRCWWPGDAPLWTQACLLSHGPQTYTNEERLLVLWTYKELCKYWFLNIIPSLQNFQFLRYT